MWEGNTFWVVSVETGKRNYSNLTNERRRKKEKERGAQHGMTKSKGITKAIRDRIPTTQEERMIKRKKAGIRGVRGQKTRAQRGGNREGHTPKNFTLGFQGGGE